MMNENPFKVPDILQQILYWTRNFKWVRHLFCINWTFYNIMWTSYTIIDDPCIICHTKRVTPESGWFAGSVIRDTIQRNGRYCSTECPFSCEICKKSNNMVGFKGYMDSPSTKIRTYELALNFRVKYFYDGVCEKCLHSAKEKTCHICSIKFMMHSDYRGKTQHCTNCYYNKLLTLPQKFMISPDEFPYIINKINI
jgi:hypothetical protein